jgi:prepilin-type N-terminal cleavage/methylation domain-containing protein
MKHNPSQAAFTLLELMITLIIVGIIATIGYTTMAGYLPKQRLIATGHYMENILQRAQSEAYARSSVVGVHFFPGTGTHPRAEVFIDANANFAQDAPPAEGPLTSLEFRDDVYFTTSTTGTCDGVRLSTSPTPFNCNYLNGGAGCYVFFNSSGQAITYNNCGGTCTPATPVDYQLFIYSPLLDNTINARKVEVLSSGLVTYMAQPGLVGNAAGGMAATTCAQ